jgi:hypothetical protein
MVSQVLSLARAFAFITLMVSTVALAKFGLALTYLR